MASFPLEMRMLMGPAFKKYESQGILGTIMRSKAYGRRASADSAVNGGVDGKSCESVLDLFLNSTLYQSKPYLGFWTTNLGAYINQQVDDTGRHVFESADASARNMNFSGVWEFDSKRSDSSESDAQLKALGLPWWKRVIARRAKPVISVDYNDGSTEWKQRLNFPILGPFYELQESLKLDGTEQTSKMHGFKLVQRSHRDGECVVTRTLVDDKHHGIIRRRIIEGGKTYYVTSTLQTQDGEVITKRTYFRRKG